MVENKGAAVVDGIGVAEFKDQLKQHWPRIKAKLLAREYMPQPVRRVDIPKPQGGVRTLGIPTLMDRLIQQALHQVATCLEWVALFATLTHRGCIPNELCNYFGYSTTVVIFLNP